MWEKESHFHVHLNDSVDGEDPHENEEHQGDRNAHDDDGGGGFGDDCRHRLLLGGEGRYGPLGGAGGGWACGGWMVDGNLVNLLELAFVWEGNTCMVFELTYALVSIEYIAHGAVTGGYRFLFSRLILAYSVLWTFSSQTGTWGYTIKKKNIR